MGFSFCFNLRCLFYLMFPESFDLLYLVPFAWLFAIYYLHLYLFYTDFDIKNNHVDPLFVFISQTLSQDVSTVALSVASPTCKMVLGTRNHPFAIVASRSTRHHRARRQPWLENSNDARSFGRSAIRAWIPHLRRCRPKRKQSRFAVSPCVFKKPLCSAFSRVDGCTDGASSRC